MSFRLTTEEYTQIENRGCLSAATPFDCVSRRILNDPKMRLGSRILGQKYLRVAGSSTPISRLLIMNRSQDLPRTDIAMDAEHDSQARLVTQVLNVCPKQSTQRTLRWGQRHLDRDRREGNLSLNCSRFARQESCCQQRAQSHQYTVTCKSALDVRGSRSQA